MQCGGVREPDSVTSTGTMYLHRAGLPTEGNSGWAVLGWAGLGWAVENVCFQEADGSAAAGQSPVAAWRHQITHLPSLYTVCAVL